MSPVFRTWALVIGILGGLVRDASAIVTIVSVPVGDINNPANWIFDVGSVGYNYSIGKYEVTLNQYCAFLNAVGATDTYGLYNYSLSWMPEVRGISRSGASGSYRYSVSGSGNRPVTYVSWFDAARFVNCSRTASPPDCRDRPRLKPGSTP